MLFGINASGSDAQRGNWWVIYPVIAWGAALSIHPALVLFGGLGRFGGWEERKVDDLVRREKRHKAT